MPWSIFMTPNNSATFHSMVAHGICTKFTLSWKIPSVFRYLVPSRKQLPSLDAIPTWKKSRRDQVKNKQKLTFWLTAAGSLPSLYHLTYIWPTLRLHSKIEVAASAKCAFSLHESVSGTSNEEPSLHLPRSCAHSIERLCPARLVGVDDNTQARSSKSMWFELFRSDFPFSLKEHGTALTRKYLCLLLHNAHARRLGILGLIGESARLLKLPRVSHSRELDGCGGHAAALG